MGIALLLFCPRPDEPVGLVPPVLPMTKEPGGELEAPAVEGSDIAAAAASYRADEWRRGSVRNCIWGWDLLAVLALLLACFGECPVAGV
jgi:hypothetical protein